MPIIHELAAEPRSQKYLLDIFENAKLGTRDEFNVIFDKVTTPLDDNPTLYTLRKLPWRELNIWKYEYANEEDRVRARDRAIEVYDRMQLGRQEPEWERLLPMKDRGKGICLSKLQKKLAQNAADAATAKAAPKPHRSRSRSPAPGSPRDADRTLKKPGGESMARSTSQPIGNKSKKPSERDAQTKRLLGKTTKPAAQRATTPKVSTPKVSPAKAAINGSGGKKDGRILSKEFITESDEDSDDEDTPLAVKPVAKPTVAERPKAFTPLAHATPPSQKPKPAALPAPAKSDASTQPPRKRARDDDDGDSSSETPLSKRVKQKEQKPTDRKLTEQSAKAANHSAGPKKHRSSDSSQSSRSVSSSNNSLPKAKNTSPAKSSPLASSPPTNASDFDSAQESIIAKSSSKSLKRKADESASKTPRDGELSNGVKRQRASSVSDKVLQRAKQYHAYYPTYKQLHNKVAALTNPPAADLERLMDMHERLQEMKAEIYREVAPV
jgi:RNA polymerase II elongation factor ELL